MSERRPTLAVADSAYLNEDSRLNWRKRINKAGFNYVDASGPLYASEHVARHVEASIGVVILNQELSASGELGRIRALREVRNAVFAAKAFKLPAYILALPAADDELATEIIYYPNTFYIGDDLSLIARQWPLDKQESAGGAEVMK